MSEIVPFPLPPASTPTSTPTKPASTPTKGPRWTDLQLRALLPEAKPRRVKIDPGLYLQVTPSARDPKGSKSWIFRYQANGLERQLGLGPFPEISLADARAKAAGMQVDRAQGADPAAKREEERAAARAATTTFESVALEWLEVNKARWSEDHRRDVLGRLQEEVFPRLGAKAIADITPLDCIAVVRAIEPRSVDIARRVRARLDQIFAYAIAHGQCPTNPAAQIKAAMAPLPKGGFRPAIVELEPLRAMLQRVEQFPAAYALKAANRFLALTGVRPGEVRQAQWEQFEGLDGDAPLWRIPAEQMKMGREHVVPLSRQAVELLVALRYYTGESELVFPAAQGELGPLSENAIGHLLGRAGYRSQHCAHGWRASFSTVMNDRDPAAQPLVEAALAHAKDDAVAARYNRGEYLEARRPLMQAWADLLLADAVPAAKLLSGRKRR